MRAPGAVPNLCKADSGLSAMPVIGILAAISWVPVLSPNYKITNSEFLLQVVEYLVRYSTAAMDTCNMILSAAVRTHSAYTVMGTQSN